MLNDSGPMKRLLGANVSISCEWICNHKDDHSQRVPLYDMKAAANLIKLFEGTWKKHNWLYHYTKPSKLMILCTLPRDGNVSLIKSGDIVIYKRINNIEAGGFSMVRMYLLSIDIDGDDTTVVKYIQIGEYVKLVESRIFIIHQKM